jgi:predicted SAM-dependent methyltransferase
MGSDADRQTRLLEEIASSDRRGINVEDPAHVRALKRAVPQRTRDPLRALATTLVLPYARRRAQALANRRPLRLNLGCGFAPIEGWTNIDLIGAPVDLPWHLGRGIPFPDGSVDAVFSEHLFEHLTLAAGLRLARESVRVLRPGGVVRVVVPDAGRLLCSYAGVDDETWARSRSTRMQAVMALFYENGHRTMYDAELLTTLLAAAGAIDARESAFREGRLSDCAPDGEHRRAGSLYVEGSKSAEARTGVLPDAGEAGGRGS